MTQLNEAPQYRTVSAAQVQATFNAAMARVYVWMGIGLGITTLVAWGVSGSTGIVETLFGNWWVLPVLFFVQIGIIGAISSAAANANSSAALGMFFLFSALEGLILSAVFLAFDLGTIRTAFWATSATFGTMAFFGLTTRKDLTSLGPLLFVGLIGLIVAMLINMFVGSSALEWVVSILGVVIFMGLTAYDSQKIKEMTAAAVQNNEAAVVVRSIGVLGALNLYLDFINLFLFILRILDRD